MSPDAIPAAGAVADPDALRRADAKARSLAQTEFVAPLVVEAGAGTGKTATLVARVLAWSMGPGWAQAERELAGSVGGARDLDSVAQTVTRGVAAITFTEAAAAEMAERVALGLAGIATADLPPGVDADALPRAHLWQPRAEALLGALDLLEVRTIHAFCRRLLQDHCLSAGLHPAFGVDADGEQRATVIDEVVERALAEGLGQPPDPDLLSLATLGFGPADLVAAVDAFVQQAVDPSLLLTDPCNDDAMAPLVSGFVAALGQVAPLLVPVTQLKGRSNLKALAPVLVELAEHLGATPSASAVQACAAALAEDHSSALTKLAKARLSATERGWFDTAWQQAVCDAGGRLAQLAEFMGTLDPEASRRAMRVLAPLVTQARAELRRRGWLGFDELLVASADLLDERPDVVTSLRRDLRQLLVDEFQDTDPRQCRVVAALALNDPPQTRPGLFIVGDPKQSIYGWRSADLQAYEDFVNQVVHAGGQRVSLAVNFRSVPAVLDAVAGAMGPTMIREPGRQPPFQPLLPAPHLADAAGYVDNGHAPVELWALWPWDDTGDTRQRRPKPLQPDIRTLEATALATDLAALGRSGVDWSDVAVLFRSSGDLPTMVDALRAAGVPYAVERDRNYFRRREIVDGIALVALVTQPHDHVSLIAWLRSAMVGLPDAALLPLWGRGFPQLVSELDGPDPDRLAALAQVVDGAAVEVAALAAGLPGLERLPQWPAALHDGLHRLAALRAAWRVLPADHFVAALRELSLIEVGEAARYQGAWRLANLERLFRQLEDALARGGEIHSVLRRLRQGLQGTRDAEEGRPLGSGRSAVSLMTIHKSKGLGFGHVYVVGLDKAGQARRDQTEVHNARAWRVLGGTSPGLLAARQRDSRVESAERVRLLYVAMTRAKQRLVLSAAWPEQPGATPLADASRLTELLGLWSAVPADLMELADGLLPDQDRWRDKGVTWRVPERHHGPDAQPTASPSPMPPDSGPPTMPGPAPLARVRADHRALAAARQLADARMQRPWTAGPSGQAHQGLAAGVARSADRAQGQRLPQTELDVLTGVALDPRAVATAAGTAVHAALEQLDLAAPAAAFDLIIDQLGPAMTGQADPALADAAVARARLVLRHVQGGPLLQRLVQLAPAVVARELDLLAPPGADGPVGAIVGAIDLVYADPDDGRLVVADYKTDDLDDGQLDERVSAYRPQLQAYAQALTQALDLPRPPHQELWFLLADRIVRLPG